MLLNMIKKMCPDAVFDEKTLFIVNWSAEIDKIYDYEQVIMQDNSDIPTLTKLAGMEIALLNSGKAKRYIKRILELEPDNINALELSAITKLEKEWRVKKVVDIYNKLLSYQPENIQFMRNAAIHMLMANDPQGIEYARKVISKYPKEVTVYRELRNHYFRNKQPGQAAETLRELKKQFRKDHIAFIDNDIEYILKYSRDPSFRRWQNIKLYGGCILIVIVGIVITVLTLRPIILFVKALIKLFQ